MPRKIKKAFDAAREVRAIARERIGTPPGARVVKDRREKKAKHPKQSIEKELG